MPGLLRNDSLVTNPNLRRYPRSDREWAHFIQELNRQGVALNSSGVFTPLTYSGFSTDPVGNINYSVFGDMASIWATENITGVSDATDFSFAGGVPVEARPVTQVVRVPIIVFDNDTAGTMGMAQVNTTGGIVFYTINAETNNGIINATGFTNANAKGWVAGAIITYPIGP